MFAVFWSAMMCLFVPRLQMADVVESAKMAHIRPSGSSAAAMDESRGSSKGFVVREAPWTTGSEKVRHLTEPSDLFMKPKVVRYNFIYIYVQILYNLTMVFT